MQSLATLCTGAAAIVVMWYGGGRVVDGNLSLGQLLFVNGLLGYLLQPLERLAAANLQLQDALVAIDRLYQILDIEAEPLEAAPTPIASLGAGIDLFLY